MFTKVMRVVVRFPSSIIGRNNCYRVPIRGLNKSGVDWGGLRVSPFLFAVGSSGGSGSGFPKSDRP
jgi:hypothetical protein